MAAKLAAARGARVSGIDAAEALLTIARSRVPGGDFHHGDIEELLFSDQMFNVVTASDGNRDLVETTPSGLGCLNFYHPEMQQRLLGFAVAAGVELWRPAEVAGVMPGDPPVVVVRRHGGSHVVTNLE